MRRIYVAGAAGMLGDAVVRELRTTYEVRATDLRAREGVIDAIVDVSSGDALMSDVGAFEPDALINLAAETDLEFCERNPNRAWRHNALGAENTALVANDLDIPCVFISTAGIFGGEKMEYHDWDVPRPLSTYGASKLAGEQFTLQHCRKPFVLRAGWMMGGGPDLDKKFVNKIFKQIASGAREISAVTDKFGTPTYTYDFAKGLRLVLESGYYGLYNQVCGGTASRYDVAEEFVRQLGLEAEVVVRPVGSDYFAEEYFAMRPASEQLVNDKLDARGLNVMRPWRDALADYARSAFLPRLNGSG